MAVVKLGGGRGARGDCGSLGTWGQTERTHDS